MRATESAAWMCRNDASAAAAPADAPRNCLRSIVVMAGSSPRDSAGRHGHQYITTVRRHAERFAARSAGLFLAARWRPSDPGSLSGGEDSTTASDLVGIHAAIEQFALHLRFAAGGGASSWRPAETQPTIVQITPVAQPMAMIISTNRCSWSKPKNVSRPLIGRLGQQRIETTWRKHVRSPSAFFALGSLGRGALGQSGRFHDFDDLGRRKPAARQART